MNLHYALPSSVCAALAAAAVISSGEKVHGGLALALWAAAGGLGFFHGTVVTITSRREAPPVGTALGPMAGARIGGAMPVTVHAPAVALEPVLQSAL